MQKRVGQTAEARTLGRRQAGTRTQGRERREGREAGGGGRQAGRQEGGKHM